MMASVLRLQNWYLPLLRSAEHGIEEKEQRPVYSKSG
jgi:hypothetical protein